MRGPDGRLTVKGLMPGQQLVQMPDGKLQVLTTTQIQPPQAPTTTPTTTAQQVKPAPAAATPNAVANKTVIKSTPATSTGKLVVQGSQVKAILQQPVQSPVKGQQVIVKQPATQVMQKIASSPGTVVVSSNPVFQQQQVVVSGNQLITNTTGTQVN